MDVRLPDGTVIQGVPDNISKAELTAKLARNGYDVSKLADGAAPATTHTDAQPQQPHNLFDTIAALPGNIKEAVTGDKRHTATTDSLPDWAGMPELNQFSMASAKTGLGTLLANPAETVQIIQSNFPGVKVRQDEKGNYLLRSSIDGKEYAIKPGFQVSDLPRAVGAVAAFTPAGRATTIGGAALGAAGTQAAIEATQAATGGSFDPGDVAMAGVTGGAVPAVAAAAHAVATPARQIIQRARGISPIAAAEPVAVADPLATASTDAADAAAQQAQGPAAPTAAPAAAPAPEQAGPHPLDGEISSLEQRYQDLLSQSSGIAPKGAIREAKQQLNQLYQSPVDTSDAGVRVVAKQIQSNQGVSYKTALSQARQQVGDQAADYQARIGRLEGIIEDNRAAANATQELHEVGARLTSLRAQRDSAPAAPQPGADDPAPPAISDAASQEAQAAAPDAATGPGATIDPTAGPAEPGPAATRSASPASAPVPPMAAGDLTQTARKAAEGGFGSTRATRVLAEQAAPDAKVIGAAERLGVDGDLQPDHVTTNQAYREIAQAAKSIPGSEGRAAELDGLKRVAQRANDLVEQLGGTHDFSTLADNVKSELQDVHDQLKGHADDLYDQIRSAVPAKAEAPANNVLAMIKARADDLGGMQNLSPAEKMVFAKLSPKRIRQTETIPGDPLMPGAQTATTRAVRTTRQPTYALLDDVRRDLTAARVQRAGPFKDSDGRLISMLEDALKKDQRAVLEQHGMTAKWDLAQSTAAAYKGIQNDLATLFGKKLDESFVGKVSTAMKALPAGDPTQIIRLLRAVPENMRQEVVASGLNTALGKTAANGEVSFSKYAQWYEGLLRNKQSHAAVMTNLPPEARKQLSDLYRVSKGISAATRERITTGRLNAIKDELKPIDKFTGRLYKVARESALGATVGSAVGAVAGPGVGAAVASALAKGAKPEAIKAVDKLLVSPEFTELARRTAFGIRPEQQAAIRRFVQSPGWRRFAHVMKMPSDPTAAQQWVTQALQAERQHENRDKHEHEHE